MWWNASKRCWNGSKRRIACTNFEITKGNQRTFELVLNPLFSLCWGDQSNCACAATFCFLVNWDLQLFLESGFVWMHPQHRLLSFLCTRTLENANYLSRVYYISTMALGIIMHTFPETEGPLLFVLWPRTNPRRSSMPDLVEGSLVHTQNISCTVPVSRHGRYPSTTVLRSNFRNDRRWA